MLVSVLLAFVGLLLLMTLPWWLPLRVVLAVAWVTHCGESLGGLVAGWKTYCRIRLSDGGDVQLVGINPIAAQLLPGSVRWRQCAWLWMQNADGRKMGEFVRRSVVKDSEWSRFGMLWAHRADPLGSKRKA